MSRKFIRFGLIGIFNTVLNLVLFNVLLFALNLSISWANPISIFISISISFFLNAKFVFSGHAHRRKKIHTYGLFFASSLFSQILVQQLIISIFVYHVTAPGDLVNTISDHLPLLSGLSKRFYMVNTAKLLAVAVSMCTNYLLYSKIVFNNDAKGADSNKGVE